METRFIPLEQTGLFPKLIRDYISGREDMSPFYDFAPSMEGLKERLGHVKGLSKDNKDISEVLESQHGSSISEVQKENLMALKADEAFTICTGHQLCLFTGPVYMIYKIASVIKLSQALSKETGERIVPLFWMATEDHDVEEIDHTWLFGKEIKLDTDYHGAVGRMQLSGVDRPLEQLTEILGDSDNGHALLNIMRAAYDDGKSMTQAFRTIIQSLFSKYGLLILDADDHALKRMFLPSLIDEVMEGRIQGAIQSTIEMLKYRGESVQAEPREINLFYLEDGIRSRLVYDGERIAVHGHDISWDREEFKVMADKYPERLSPNVLLRPLFQEHILPNLAYVGGPGELSYWLQLKSVFEAFKMKMPVLLLRDSFMWIDKKTESKWESLGFELSDLFRSLDGLQKEFALKSSTVDPDLSGEKEQLLSHFDGLIERSRQIDPGILGFANAEKQRLVKAIDNMEKKLVRAEKKKHGSSLDKIAQLKEKFLPGGGLRERKENFMHWYLRQGDGFIETVVEKADPLNPQVKVLKM